MPYRKKNSIPLCASINFTASFAGKCLDFLREADVGEVEARLKKIREDAEVKLLQLQGVIAPQEAMTRVLHIASQKRLLFNEFFCSK